MAAKPISDSVITRRPFLCQEGKGVLSVQLLHWQVNCQNKLKLLFLEENRSLCKPLNNVLHGLCPLCGGRGKQGLGAACCYIDHTALWRLQQVPGQRALLQQLTLATSKTHCCTQTLQLRATQKSSNYATMTVYLCSRSSWSWGHKCFICCKSICFRWHSVLVLSKNTPVKFWNC